ncbi:MAG: Aminotransferase class-III [Candidatus Uhrbacteria bacterium GW2011_GWF2_39_13]|uniref:Aminotransferase class-III n=1 Tax=Candidatus Uhrbacteria bacterium GW2011_GWF2_39_13 TaxID=1618995 RepID=A0A0G0MVC3_9BACT|nr:MAG: Aminotransferase class-III [Candidatus Uhrbacteria bacterium GW2011_GWF2_39_13]
MNENKSPVTQELYEHAKKIIPGGTQLLSKRPELYAPGQWPAYYSKASGCEVWDLDGNHYYDMSTNGIGACLLGFNDIDVSNAVKSSIDNGSMCSLNPPEEVYLADKLCGIHPWAENVRFTRSGGEAMTVAVRIARASTDRSVIAVCGYHGWHDWYLAANLGADDSLRGHLLPGLEPIGVPVELRNTTVAFSYNNMEQFENIVKKYGKRLAAVVMEPCKYSMPENNFLEKIREITEKNGTVLIFDEITIGWRLCFGGSHLKLGVNPDMAVFAKALGNGHPIGAVIGTANAMEGAQKSFISSTYWTERTGPAAALSVLDKMSRINIPEYVAKIGNTVVSSWKNSAQKYSLPIVIPECSPCFAKFNFKHEKENELKTLFVQYMLKQGFLATPFLYPTLAHTETIVKLYSEAVEVVFSQISHDMKVDKISEKLRGPVAHSGFKRLN